MHHFIRDLRAVLTWAMLPLALWTARPQAGCICSDGHYEAFCGAYLSRADELRRGCEHCTNCHSTGSTAADAGPDRAADPSCDLDCCGRHGADDGNESGCTPVVQSAAVVGKSSAFLSDHDEANAGVPPSESGTAVAAASSIVHMGERHTVPPLDRVIALRRLLI